MKTKKKREQSSNRRFHWELVVVFLVIIAGTTYLCSSPIRLLSSFVIPRSYNPGFKDMFSNVNWNYETISRFLAVPLPESAANLTIEGSMGLVGSYGIMPRLSFQFDAPPDDAMQFVEQFCDGILHPGYYPFNSINSSEPSDDAILIHNGTTLYYSSSPNIPETILGNRCARHQDLYEQNKWFWEEEFVVDKANPNLYRVYYNLPFEANRDSSEQYPTAKSINPFGERFRLNITGFNSEHVLVYHTVCMETSEIRHYTINFEPDSMIDFAEAEISISIDGIEKPNAFVSNPELSLQLSDTNRPFQKWQYCLNADWEVGTHTMRIQVKRTRSDILELKWDFTVPES